jgi:hypothetical protein
VVVVVAKYDSIHLLVLAWCCEFCLIQKDSDINLFRVLTAKLDHSFAAYFVANKKNKK